MKRLLMIGILLLAGCEIVGAQDKPPVDCPKISIKVPEEVVGFGISSTFEAVVHGIDPSALNFQWSIDRGSFVSSSDLQIIEVMAPQRPPVDELSEVINVTVRINGLPSTCQNEVHDSKRVYANFHLELVDEYGRVGSNEEKARLETFLSELLQHPKDTGYVVVGFIPNMSSKALEKRIKRIQSYIFGTRKIPKERIVILSQPSSRETVTIYRIPTKWGDGYFTEAKVH